MNALGSLQAYANQPTLLLLALCASALPALVAAIDILTTLRPADRALTSTSALATAAWLAVSVTFVAI
jgi:hypothetical protein